MHALEVAFNLRSLIRQPEDDETPLSDEEVVLLLAAMSRTFNAHPLTELEPA